MHITVNVASINQQYQPTSCNVLADYARWQQVRNSAVHTDSSLRMLEDMTVQLAKRIQTMFGKEYRPGENWAFPKFAHMARYAGDIREFGCIENYDSGPRERLNKELRQAWLRTNKKGADLDKQVCLAT